MPPAPPPSERTSGKAADAEPSVTLLGPTAGHEAILTEDALSFVAALTVQFRPRIVELLAARVQRQAALDAGAMPDFLAETASVREGDWTVAPMPADLTERRVEITGPIDAKMIINALNSGANVFMADCEDSCAPTWAAQVSGQQHLHDAVRRTLTFRDEARGKEYALGPDESLATLMVRPRGLHLPEKHMHVDGQPVPGCLFDFGLYFFHNAKALGERGSGPYFYLPKLQSHLEARLWNDVFCAAQDALGIARGTIRATVLIETLPAAFEMDEILYELRDHSAGLNCGRWDYIFSFIKTFATRADFVLPDRSQVGMTQPNMAAYTQLVIKTCHRRGIHAMGGMAAQIPIKGDAAANEAALAKVRADKEREAKAGHDGTWVAHPGLIATAKAQFDAAMPGKHQIDNKREDVAVTAADLVAVPQGTRSDEGLRHNIRVGIQYLEAWLGGNGCVPLYNLMEDAATAEISRAQVWQWRAHGVDVGGSPVTDARLAKAIDEELQTIRSEVGAARYDAGKFALARTLFEDICTADSLPDFLTLVAYDHITTL
ncbi:MAG: malate synthase A [Myxococcota bacterium]